MATAEPSDNLYMKGLPNGTTDESIRSLFGPYGTVVSTKILACPPGVSDAAALVRFGSVSEAVWLVENATTIASGLGISLQMRYAHNTKGQGKGEGKAQPTSQPTPPGQPSNRLYMRGFPLGITEDQLKTVMGAYGTVASCKVLPSPPAGASDSACIVQMGSAQEAQWLVDHLDGNIPQGLTTPVVVKFKSDQLASQGGGGGAPRQAGPPVPTGTIDFSATAMGAAMAAMGMAVPQPAVSMMGPAEPKVPAQPSNNLYVKGTPTGATEETIKEIFGIYGTVNSVKILPPSSGKGDTACLVCMGSVEEAKWLVEHVHGNIPQGLTDPVQVRFADNAKGGGKGGPPPGPMHYPAEGAGPSDNLYMKGLPWDTTESSLMSIFTAYGTVASVKVLSSTNGQGDAAALVRMGSVREAQWLVDNVNGNIPQGLTSPVQIKFASNSKGSGKGAGWGYSSAPQGAGWGYSSAPQGAAGGWGWNSAPNAGHAPSPSDNLYMKGFPGEITDESIKALITPYGTVVSVKVLPPPPGKTCAAALVRMSTMEEAKWLVDNMSGNMPEGLTAPIEVKFAANSGGSQRWSPY